MTNERAAEILEGIQGDYAKDVFEFRRERVEALGIAVVLLRAICDRRDDTSRVGRFPVMRDQESSCGAKGEK